LLLKCLVKVVAMGFLQDGTSYLKDGQGCTHSRGVSDWLHGWTILAVIK
jgi:hypothetical protein